MDGRAKPGHDDVATLRTLQVGITPSGAAVVTGVALSTPSVRLLADKYSYEYPLPPYRLLASQYQARIPLLYLIYYHHFRPVFLPQ
jgi:hypothetical protein